MYFKKPRHGLFKIILTEVIKLQTDENRVEKIRKNSFDQCSVEKIRSQLNEALG